MMSRTKSAYLMPLRKRMTAVAVSAVMVFGLCPWGQALADTGSESESKKAVQVGSSDSGSKSDVGSAKTQSSASSRSISDNESSDEDNNIATSGQFDFELWSGSKLLGTVSSNDEGVYENKSFGEVDFGSKLTLKVFGPNGYLDEGSEFKVVSGLDKTSVVGSHEVKVQARGNSYKGEITLSYTIGGDLGAAKVTTHFKNDGYYAYTGGSICPKLTLAIGGTTLKEGTDYALRYSNNVSGSTATVHAEGKGAFRGKTKEYSFHIVGLTYNSYGQGKWKGSKTLGQTSGVSSGTTKVGKIAVKKSNNALGGNVEYGVFNDTKWFKHKNGGTAGSAKPQAAQTMWIKLTGDMGKRFDIYYRVCISGAGWMAWAKNGGYAGVKNFNSKMKITGYQVKLVEKNGARPANADLGTVYASNWDGFAKDILYSRIKNKTSRSNYTISVDTTFNRVAVYKGSQGKWKLQKYWKCGTGIKSRPTTKGDFTLSSKKRARIDSGNISYWNFRGYGGSLGFHSVVTKLGKKSVLAKPLSKQLGVNVSHGCVRVTMSQSKYFWNLPNGTTVRIRGLV